jgi:hypothetical protein
MVSNRPTRPDDWFLPNIDRLLKAAEENIESFLTRRRFSHWHPISTAPHNRDLELCAVAGSVMYRLPFPCRRTNDGLWLNADLGTSVRIEPVKWRVWLKTKSPELHSSLSQKETPPN